MIVIILNILMIIIATIDVYVDCKKYYKVHKVFIDYLVKTYPYRIALIVLFIVKSVYQSM